MSDGGGESVKDHCNKRVKYAVNEFGLAVAKVAVAQICECEGYQGFQQSALEMLSNVAVRYIQSLGKSAKYQAELAGRSECNVFDIVQGLEDFGEVQGFPGASDIDRCPATSGVVKELVQYVSESEEIPFAYNVLRYPIVKDRQLAPSFEQGVGESPACHIPSWLAAFPYPLTFVLSPEKVGNDGKVEQIDKVEHQKRCKEANPMLSSQHHMPHNGLERPSSDALNSSMAGRSVETIPFLASPLKFDEAKVSTVVFPKKLLLDNTQGKNGKENHGYEENHFCEMENPASAANQLDNHLHAYKDDNLTAQDELRAVVKFSLRVTKKNQITNDDGSDEENCKDGMNSRFEKVGPDDKKDNKKWAADQNSKEGIENSEEVAQ